METLFICLLYALGAMSLFLSGVFAENNPGVTFVFALCGAIMFVTADGLTSEAASEVACEKMLAKYINGEVTYDTVAVDKDGKLLEIKIKDKSLQ